MCDVICAIANQSVLYVDIFLVPLLLIGMFLALFNAMKLHRMGQLIGLSIGLVGCTFFGLVPWYITVITIAYTVYATNRIRSQQLNET